MMKSLQGDSELSSQDSREHRLVVCTSVPSRGPIHSQIPGTLIRSSGPVRNTVSKPNTQKEWVCGTGGMTSKVVFCAPQTLA